jgi:hypothetical protein
VFLTAIPSFMTEAAVVEMKAATRAATITASLERQLALKPNDELLRDKAASARGTLVANVITMKAAYAESMIRRGHDSPGEDGKPSSILSVKALWRYDAYLLLSEEERELMATVMGPECRDEGDENEPINLLPKIVSSTSLLNLV